MTTTPPATFPPPQGLLAPGPDPHLLGGSCQTCTNLHFPAADTCPYCGADTVETTALPTEGTLWAWTTVTAAPPGYVGPVPYGFGVVELAGRIRVVTRLTETDASAWWAGQPVHLVVDDVGPGPETPVPVWAFAPGAP